MFGKLAFRRSIGKAWVVSVGLSPNHRWVPGKLYEFSDGLFQVESLERWVFKRKPETDKIKGFVQVVVSMCSRHA